jgi:hypothetical protein
MAPERDNLLFLAADFPLLCDLRRILEHDLKRKMGVIRPRRAHAETVPGGYYRDAWYG